MSRTCRESGNALWSLCAVVAIVVVFLVLTRPESAPVATGVNAAEIQGERLDAPVAVPREIEPDPSTEQVPSGSKYRFVTFQPLSDFRMPEPNWDRASEKDYIESLRLRDEIPEKVRELDGEPVEMLGFMMPLDVELENVSTFMLLPNTQLCCFGNVPRINEWVYVAVPDDQDIEYQEDILLSVAGTLRVGPSFDHNEMLCGIYRIEVDDIRYDY